MSLAIFFSFYGKKFGKGVTRYESHPPSLRTVYFIRWCKVIFACLATFFGAGFSIMTFNNDVDIPALFEQIYTQITGQHAAIIEDDSRQY